MQFSDYAFISSQSRSIFPLFSDNVAFPLTAIQKKVACVALVVLSCALTCCLLYRLIFKWKVNPLSIPQKGIIASDASEIKEIEKKEDLSLLSGYEDFVKSNDTKFKILPLLFFNLKQLDEYADITLKNASSIEDARVVLIGNTHTMPSRIDLMLFIIARFARNEDIHLVEAAEGKTKRLFDQLDTYGWDNMELSKKYKKVVKQLLNLRERRLKSENFPKNQNPSQENTDNIALKLLNNLLFFCHKRTESLIKCLHDTLLKFPDKKIFVTAGKSHLVEGDTFNILDYLPPKEKCALIMLKDLDPTTFDDDLKYAESLVEGMNFDDSI